MKKITTLMVMLMGCVFSALAQTVASTATALESLQSGYYMLMVKSDDDKTDANGNYAYNTSDGYVSYEAKGSTTDFLGKTLTSTDEFDYLFYVEKASDGKISLRAWKDKNLWWKDCGTATSTILFGGPGRTPWDQTKFPLSSSKAGFDMSAVGNYGCYLVAVGSVYESGKAKPTDYNVVCNNDNQMGYARSSSATNKAQFRFYAVSNVPDPEDVISFTYKYTDGEHSKSVTKNLMLIGYDFPEPNDIDFLVGTKPTGKISADDNGKTFTIQCHVNLPFQTSTDDAPIYYYLENVKGTRLYANSGLKFRDAKQAANVNDVRNDLWYVTGNVFDGFQFHSVASGDVMHSKEVMSHITALVCSGKNASITRTWALYDNKDGFAVCPQAGEPSNFYGGKFSEAARDYSWKLDDDANGVGFKIYEAGDDAFSFRLVHATFTFPMYSGNDNNVYNTFAAPFAVALADDETAVKMYKGTVNNTGKELVLSEVNAVPANAGVMLMGESTQADNVKFKVIADASDLESNDLVGTTSDVTDLTDKLILGISEETGRVGFFSALESVAALTANHAYLNKTNTTMQTLSVRLAGQPTSIGQISVDNENKQAAVYDLTGRRVNRTVKGQLYIQNGRKFIAR